MNIKYFEYFVILSQKESISEAAKSIFMEQSGLSKIITKMENHYGVQLFNRTTKGISLTPEGMNLLPFAKAITEKHHTSLRCVPSNNNSTLMVYYSVGLSRWLIPASQQLFFQKHPEVIVDSFFFQLQDFCQVCINNPPDIAIVYDLHINQDIRSFNKEKIIEDSFVLAISDQHPFANRSSVTVDDLSGQSLVFVNGPSKINTLQMLDEYNVSIDALTYPNVQSAENVVLCGHAASLRSMSDIYENGSVFRYIPIEGLPPTTLYAIYGADKKSLVKDFIKCIKAAERKYLNRSLP
ncbi:MAG: LysR family transcriptional regulator [Lachnospiraceae bacterium]|jgi:DNA-binding transcriptional LysR family regulator